MPEYFILRPNTFMSESFIQQKLAAAKSNIEPSTPSPAFIQLKWWITMWKIADQASDDDEGCDNLEYGDLLRPGEEWLRT